jgi:hypothetical protein
MERRTFLVGTGAVLLACRSPGWALASMTRARHNFLLHCFWQGHDTGE